METNTIINSISNNPLLRAILHSKLDSDLVKLILSRSVPFTELEYLEVYVYLLKIKKLKPIIIPKIDKISDVSKIKYLMNPVLNLRTAYYLLMRALLKNDLNRLSIIVHHKGLPITFIEKVAQKGSTEAVEILMENQQKIIQNPHLLEIIKDNPNRTTFIESSIKEIHELYLNKKQAVKRKLFKKKHTTKLKDIPLDQLVGEEEDFEIEDFEMAESELEQTPESFAKQEADKKEKEESYHQHISDMGIPEKIILARLGTGRDRMTLIKDANKLVSKAVIESPKLKEAEVVQIASNRSLDAEIISAVAKNKKWHTSYKIIASLAFNPKIPVKEGMAFTRKLTSRDLKMISKDRNANPVIRNFATKVIQTKQ